MTAAPSMKALRQHKQYDPLVVEDVPVPTADAGSAVVQVLAAGILSYMKEIYDGTRKYPYVTPLTTGSSAIGRIHAVGPDSTSLQVGQLVMFDSTIRSRDDPSHIFLSALSQGSSAGSRQLMSYWTDGSHAEYIKTPLENVNPLNEDRLLGELGYTVPELLSMLRMSVPWGGMSDIDLRPGETVIVAPATGPFGRAAVHVALAIGARVIAMGRNTKVLEQLQTSHATQHPADRLLTVPITGDFEQEKAALAKAAGSRPIDAYYDISPPAAANGSFFQAAILSLRHSGRVSLMGGQLEEVKIPYRQIMRLNLQLKGKWMYERSDIPKLVRLIESGNCAIGERGGFGVPKEFGLGQWKEAFEYAAEHSDGAGAVFVPRQK